MLFTFYADHVIDDDQATNTRRVTRRGNDENAVPTQAARTKSAATSLGPPQKVAQPSAGAVKKPAASGVKVSGAKRTALGGVVNNVNSNIKEELDEKKPGRCPFCTSR
jgi:hypothetical protein